MNKIFAAKLPDGNTGLSDGGSGQDLTLLANSKAPGTIPADVNPPHPPSVAQPDDAPVSAVATTAPAVTTTRMASATANPPSSGGFFHSLARKVGFGTASATDAAAAPPAVQPASPSKPKTILAKRFEPRHPAAKKPETRQAAARKSLKPSATETPSATAAAEPAGQNSLVAGAQPIVQSNSFDSRFTAVK